MFENIFPKKPNILILMTDQQRNFRDFPVAWIDEHMQNYRRLQLNGLTFNRGMCNSCRCSPSRSVLITGTYPAQTKVYRVGQTLTPDHKGLGHVAEAGGYEMVYKGKWHLTGTYDTPSKKRPVDENFAHQSNAQIALDHKMGNWNFPDAGNSLVMTPAHYAKTEAPVGSGIFESPSHTLGGDDVQNDNRIVRGGALAIPGEESAIEFVQKYKVGAQAKPFCMVVSLVNPHDSSVYPHALAQSTYVADRAKWQAYQGFEPPVTAADNTVGRPQIHKTFLSQFDEGVKLTTEELKENLQFYAYLHKYTDDLFNELMDAMGPDLINDTIIIRLADHGEMAGAHSGMREKDFNAFNETLNIPFVVSNPRLFAAPQSSEALVGLVDIVPTVAAIMGVEPVTNGFNFKGNDFSGLLEHKASTFPDRAVFTFDDYQMPAASHQLKHIRCMVKQDCKFVVYFRYATWDVAGPVDASVFQYELYVFNEDPLEQRNLLPTGESWSPEATAMLNTLYAELNLLMAPEHTGTMPEGWPATPPASRYV
jgi:choline-sulfatase